MLDYIVSSLYYLAVFGLIFRARGQAGYGDIFGSVAWGLFTAMMLAERGHTADWQWFCIDFAATTVLMNIAARPGWSRDCWPAWESSYQFVRDAATRASVLRALWFSPLLTYIAYRGGHGTGIDLGIYSASVPTVDFLLTLSLCTAFYWGFALIMRWNESIRIACKIFPVQYSQWCFGEILLGIWIGFIQLILGA